MHTTDPIKRCKIFSVEDLEGLCFDEYTSIEIYAKNMTFDFREINGNLLVRGEGCSFPELINIRGNLSVDAINCVLPKLRTVEGHLAMHYSAKLDRLEKVQGNFKCIVDFRFKNPIKIGGSTEVKNAEVYSGSRNLKDRRKIIEISHQYQADALPKDGNFNIDVLAGNIVFSHREIRGRINIYSKNVAFPNLEYVHGRLKIECRDKTETAFSHDFPVLKKMTGNMKIDQTRISFPGLEEITGNIEMINNSYVAFPMLEKSGSIFIRQYAGAQFPVLKEINGDLQNYGYETCYMAALQKVKGGFNTHQILAENIVEAGDLLMGKYVEFNHLKKINGYVNSNENFNFKSLEYIGSLVNEKQKNSKLPSLKKIGQYLYDENDDFEDLAEEIYFKIKENFFVSKDHCYIARLHSGVMYYPFKHPLTKLVSILKLRHKSFQNFVTREYEREWSNYSSPNFIKVLNTIKRLWDKVEPIRYEEFFTHYDRDFRLFCFSYLGVGTLMKKLDARKVAQDEILVNYFEYDENGNKKRVRRTNHYEVYEVENEKFRLSMWGRERQSYAVKCWCPSTSEEHWLWIESQYKNDALTAIASTFRIHENIIPHIRCLKRQGDVLICELEKEIVPEGNIRPLTAEEYFNLLEAEA
ncbi:MAG: hypothetical protein LBE92_21380 [Chryseobacterium sp.]|jgi:hypothetical protein|uniref:hypothetical protein n=1 Tax=Chryseobacterium sp. TaxID=1871047 RepID=UPI00281ADBFD|nr:hypothetical protein [Chryseobacterium sp.]MDR2238678.1 hypothetical protein [Chryseobacterium sp.]